METRTRTADDSLLAEGITLELIDRLGRIARLDVRSRFVSRHVATAPDPIARARGLGVDYIVDGTVEVDTARILMRGALTRTATGRNVRSIRVERPRRELGMLQAVVAQEIAAAVVGELAPSERARFAARPVNAEALDLVLRARALIEQYTAQGARQALALLDLALARDSAFGAAWQERGMALALSRDFVPAALGDVYIRRSHEDFQRALRLDSANAAAMTMVAYHRMRLNDLSPETEALARRGMALDRSAATTIGGVFVLVGRGRDDEAMRALDAAVRRDSLSPLLWVARGFRAGNMRRYDVAVASLAHLLTLRSSAADSASLDGVRRSLALSQGECDAMADTARARRFPLLLIRSLRCLNRRTEAESVAVSRLSDTTLSAASRAVYLAWAGRPDSALALLDRTFPEFLVLTLRNQAFDDYHTHPRYLALRHRMGLDR